MLKYFFEIPECRKHELEDIDTGYLFEDLKIFNSSGIYPEGKASINRWIAM
jgi:hypothetical protein